MCVGYTVLGPFYQRQAECGYREVREIEGAGQLSLKQEGLLGWVAPGWAADDASVVGSG